MRLREIYNRMASSISPFFRGKGSRIPLRLLYQPKISAIVEPGIVRIPHSGITEIVYKGKSTSPEEIQKKLSDTRELVDSGKGGHIFNAIVEGNKLSIGFATVVSGTMVGHIDILNPGKGSDTILGIISSDHYIEMFFESDPDAEKWIAFVDRFIKLARFFIENGYPGNHPIGIGPGKLLERMGRYNLYRCDTQPKTLEELALLPLVVDKTQQI